MPSPTGQLAQFLVCPEGPGPIMADQPLSAGDVFYRVRVFRSPRAMHAHLRRNVGTRVSSSAIAHMTGWTTTRRIEDMGEVCFSRFALTPGVIAHEAVHAAHYWACRHGIPIVAATRRRPLATRGEERFCEAVGELVSQITVGIVLAGLTV